MVRVEGYLRESYGCTGVIATQMVGAVNGGRSSDTKV